MPEKGQFIYLDETHELSREYGRLAERQEQFREALARNCAYMRSNDLPSLAPNQTEFRAVCMSCGEEHKFRMTLSMGRTADFRPRTRKALDSIWLSTKELG